MADGETNMHFMVASDDELREAGFNPEWITRHEGEEGPYSPYYFENGTCPCCGGHAFGWTVLNIETATCHSTEWFHADAETEAGEVASMLNAAWAAGRKGRV